MAIDVVPPQGLGVIGEAEIHIPHVELFHAETENVFPVKGTEIQSVILPGYPSQFGVEVVEKHLRVVRQVVSKQGKKEVEISPPASRHERELFRNDRSFDEYF